MNIKFNKDIYEKDYLKDKYSKYAKDSEKIEGIPYINFPFTVEDIPKEYKYLSWVMIDYDSNPVVQFSWIHWLVGNYEVEDSEESIPEDLVSSDKKYVGGTNSFAGPLTNIEDEKVILNYGGPTPPDKEHVYDIVVCAHNKKLNLNKGFYYNEFIKELDKVEYEFSEGKILAKK